ncbi:MAG TPA: aminoacyl--tRNA ligase-related protein [Solirubrobacterales bacterium]|nr:aminoacyl--tRNA ligase-related protein [Solirubrobacterales bacterium]
MTRLTETLLPTLKDPPADAEALSHKLMVRAGLIRQLGAGLWTYLPAGWRAHRKVEQIIREEMEGIGCQEMLMPVLQPAEIWETTGRYGIEEMFKLEDRKGSPLVLAMTHEECITHHIAREVRSYRDLPLMLFHIQTKERDEPRPRAGVLRTREFTMKDAYSFDRDEEGLRRSYELQTEAYARILDRCGLRWYRVESDVGMMGGSGAHEYMAPCAAGEDAVALAPGFAANVEVTELHDGDPGPSGGTVEVVPAIEVGNIFKLGTRYSEPLGATFLDEEGDERPIVMGSYGIGPARIVAAAIEQGADERGIVWPCAIAPWQVHLVSLAKAGEPEREAADRLYEELREKLGAEVLYDDRDAGAGEKLTDAELLGCPLRIVAGRRGLAKGVVEAGERATGAEHELPVEDAAERALGILQGLHG